MIKNKYSNYILLIFTSLLLTSWILYSFSFDKSYEEAKYFATEGAQPIIQILEILNYRGDILKPYFILFFTLISLSFLLMIYLFLFLQKKKINSYPLIILSFILLSFIGFNVVNKLSLFLLLLVSVSLLVMISITLTVRYLSINLDNYEDGDILQTMGPFKTREEAKIYSEKEIIHIHKHIKMNHLYVNYYIYSENQENYYSDIYVETIENKNRQGE